MVYLWARQSELGNNFENKLRVSVKHWLKEKWPFKNLVFPGIDISWEAWSKIAEVKR